MFHCSDDVAMGCILSLLIVVFFILGFCLNSFSEYCEPGLCEVDRKELKKGSAAVFATSAALSGAFVLALMYSVLMKDGFGGLMGEVHPYLKM